MLEKYWKQQQNNKNMKFTAMTNSVSHYLTRKQGFFKKDFLVE